MFLFQNSHLLLCCGRSVQTQVKVARFIFASIGLYRYLPPFSFFCFRHPQIVWPANDLASGRSSRHPWRMTKGWGEGGGHNFQKSLDCPDLMCNRNIWPWHNGSLVLRKINRFRLLWSEDLILIEAPAVKQITQWKCNREITLVKVLENEI